MTASGADSRSPRNFLLCLAKSLFGTLLVVDVGGRTDEFAVFSPPLA